MIVDINCANCTHSWETNTLTDPDPYLCHNCGLDNQTMEFEPEKLENWRKSQMKEEKIPGGLAKGLTLKDLAKYHKMPLQSIKKKLDQGIKVEMEHTTDKSIAREIAMDHIYEDPNYYTKLKQIETEGLEEDGQKTSDKNMDDYKKQNNPSGKVKDPFGLSQFARELAMGLEEADPKTGTGKKPKGSGRRLYTDEDPTDTVSIKFKTKEDIVDTLNSASFKSKSHARQSQVINLIHQRVRAAYQNTKDPETKARLKRGLDYIEKRKEASKEKTKRLQKLKEVEGSAIPYGSGYKKFIPELTQYMYENGMNIKPFPSVKFITDDEVNAKDPLGITAFYDPANATIVLYTMGRHPKDILRSFAHEMVHHEQNLNKTIGTGKIKTTNTLEDDYLDKIEREAYEKGNIMFRNWTDSIKK
jgi:hypothetical protein